MFFAGAEVEITGLRTRTLRVARARIWVLRLRAEPIIAAGFI